MKMPTFFVLNAFSLFTFNYSVNELLKIKEDLTKERDDQLQEIVKLREQLAESSNKQQDLENQQEETNQRIQEVTRLG